MIHKKEHVRWQYAILLLFLLQPSVLRAQDNNKCKEGLLSLERPENNGVLNIRECSVRIDGSKKEITLIGGDDKKISLTVGYHTIFVHSRDPYDPHSPDYTWRSEKARFKINENRITVITIEPKSKDATYCCGWRIEFATKHRTLPTGEN